MLPYQEYRLEGGTLRRIAPKRYRRGRGQVWKNSVKRWKFGTLARR